MTSGGISQWNVKEGDSVEPGDVLAQVSLSTTTSFHYHNIYEKHLIYPISNSRNKKRILIILNKVFFFL